MKKSGAALAAILALQVPAWAQSDVNVFGLLDVNVRNIRVGPTSKTEMHNSSVAGSRLGFRGSEDLGGGMKASYWLEAALSPDTGTTAPRFFHRRSTLSLSGSMGELRLGRDLTASFQGFVYYDPFAVNGVGSVQNVFGGAGYTLGSGAVTSSRTDNAISYFLPSNLGGWNGQFMHALGEGVAGSAYTGLRVGYAQGPIDVSVAYSETDAVGSGKFTVRTIGGTYDFKSVKLTAVHIQNAWLPRKENVWLLGAAVPVGDAGTLRASYVPKNASGGGTDANDARQFAVGYLHKLSKRTMLYGTYSRIQNKGASNATVGSTLAGAAGQNSRGVELGIVHAF
ncbi:porin [Hydrogenophaga sp.]|uniref:porin n=1 Tax=Hydrogenophaga sp. TaxID=1904254 RepID=UPI002603E299|nr:porin [Hydrogenophaga sp.]MCW5654483.1 porin [Hydrogenophaga sp.]